MSDFFKSIRNTAGKAAFEADKIRRVSAVQSAIKPLKEEANRTTTYLGQTAYQLHQVGGITQPELCEVCERLDLVYAQISARQKEIEAIRLEEYQEPSAAPRYGLLCPNGHGELPPGSLFCQECGASAINVAPPAPASCANCGVVLLSQSRFCPGCGAPATVAQPPVENSAMVSCPHCNAPAPADSVFCPECGQRLQATEETE
jgi:RNA polymerase subunit RPABC4/transcription elongation factor Spt4